jgi:succinate-semialdehyde dehydrogenase/glutarate-semialdehyde dehydrogenase
LFSEDTDKLEKLVTQFKDGAVFINEKVSSHPNLPFGGTGISGYGRELSRFGIHEFVNIKTVVVNKY